MAWVHWVSWIVCHMTWKMSIQSWIRRQCKTWISFCPDTIFPKIYAIRFDCFRKLTQKFCSVRKFVIFVWMNGQLTLFGYKDFWLWFVWIYTYIRVIWDTIDYFLLKIGKSILFGRWHETMAIRPFDAICVRTLWSIMYVSNGIALGSTWRLVSTGLLEISSRVYVNQE